MDAETANNLLKTSEQPYHYLFRLLLGIILILLFLALLSYCISVYDTSRPWLHSAAIVFLRYFTYVIIFTPVFSGLWMLFNSNAIHASDVIDRTYNKIPKHIFDFEAEEGTAGLVDQRPKDIRNFGIFHLILGLALVMCEFIPHPGLPNIADFIENLIAVKPQ